MERMIRFAPAYSSTSTHSVLVTNVRLFFVVFLGCVAPSKTTNLLYLPPATCQFGSCAASLSCSMPIFTQPNASLNADTVLAITLAVIGSTHFLSFIGSVEADKTASCVAAITRFPYHDGNKGSLCMGVERSFSSAASSPTLRVG